MAPYRRAGALPHDRTRTTPFTSRLPCPDLPVPRPVDPGGVRGDEPLLFRLADGFRGETWLLPGPGKRFDRRRALSPGDPETDPGSRGRHELAFPRGHAPLG